MVSKSVRSDMYRRPYRKKYTREKPLELSRLLKILEYWPKHKPCWFVS